jgi:hypothetical protein
MATPDDKAAQQARAARLRKRIDGITGAAAAPADTAAKEGTATGPAPANPRDFIAKRMRELAPKKK